MNYFAQTIKITVLYSCIRMWVKDCRELHLLSILHNPWIRSMRCDHMQMQHRYLPGYDYFLIFGVSKVMSDEELFFFLKLVFAHYTHLFSLFSTTFIPSRCTVVKYCLMFPILLFNLVLLCLRLLFAVIKGCHQCFFISFKG